MEISWTVEVIHGAIFEFWVSKNVLGEKENTCSMQGYKRENGQNF
jgi:hypothetical protein